MIGFRSKILVEKPQTHNVVLGERKSHIFFRLGWCILADIVGEGGAGHEEEREDEARSKGMRFFIMIILKDNARCLVISCRG
jgi:hypothetical protein